jgi:TRAP-type transport system periplasmic protein
MKRIANYLAAAGLLTAFATAHAAEEIKLTVSAGHPPVLLWVKHLRASFMKTVDDELAKTGKYKMKWNEAYGGTLAKVGSELRSIEQGVSDMGTVITVFNSAELPLHNVSYMTPFGATDPALVCSVMEDLHKKIPAIGQVWEKHNQVYLASICFENYHLLSAKPIAKLEDLKGKKLGGAGPNLGWIKGSGAVGVIGNLNTFYNDMKAGVYEGAIIFLTGAAPIKLFEVAPYLVKVDFGSPYGGGITVNKQRWDKFPDEVKTAFRKAGQVYQTNLLKEQAEKVVEAAAVWEKQGKTVDFSKEEREKLAKQIENPTKDWLAQTQKMGLPGKEVLKAFMDGVRAKGAQFARDYDKE